MQRTCAVLEEWVGSGRIPSASICVFVDNAEVFRATIGLARIEPRRDAALDQAYDLASVTKALGAAPIVATLVEGGEIDLYDPVCRYLPDVDPRVRIDHLLTHGSGYPWWRPLYELAPGAWGTEATRDALWDAARRLPLEAAPGERYSYSDIGMIVLHQVIDVVRKEPLDVLHRRFCRERWIDDLRYGGWPGAAATEICPVRGILVEGTVHDLNTAALGGISTHAGLFGTARAAATLADDLRAAVANGDGLGRALAAMWALRGPGSHAGIWDRRSPEGYTATGRFWPADSMGHTGYTGTSVWVAPSRRTTVALLTNRVHPHDVKEPIRELRPLVHDAVAADLGWV